MSSAGGGSMTGYSVPLGSTKDDEEEREFVNEVIYYLFKQGILKWVMKQCLERVYDQL